MGNNKTSQILLIALGLACLIFVILGLNSCGDDVNAVGNPHFEADGRPNDTTTVIFKAKAPQHVSLYIETSGSMNGFFRANRATKFKTTVWSVFTSLSNLADNRIHTFGNDGVENAPIPLSRFRKDMNAGLFVSNSETQVPDMLKNIIDSLDTHGQTCAVLVSDMKYSPTEQADMDALLDQYEVEIRNIVSKSGLTVSFVCATSQYLAKNGEVAEDASPYFFIIIGHATNVAYLRNAIAMLVENEGCYVESGDMAADYQTPPYSYLSANNMLPHGEYEGVYTDFDPDYNDTCQFTLRIDVSDLPWHAATAQIADSCLKIKSTQGSNVSFEVADIADDHHFSNEYKRTAHIDYRVKVYDVPADAEVIEWTYTPVPFESNYSSKFWRMLKADDEHELDGAFSFDKFIKGCNAGKTNQYSSEPKRILISTVSQ